MNAPLLPDYIVEQTVVGRQIVQEAGLLDVLGGAELLVNVLLMYPGGTRVLGQIASVLKRMDGDPRITLGQFRYFRQSPFVPRTRTKGELGSLFQYEQEVVLRVRIELYLPGVQP